MNTTNYKSKQSSKFKGVIFLLVLVLSTGLVQAQKKYKLKPQQMSGLKVYMLSGNVSKVTYTNGDFIEFDTNGNVTAIKLEDDKANYTYENKDRYKYYDEYYNIIFNDSMRIEKWDSPEELATYYLFDSKGRLKGKHRPGFGESLTISYEYKGDDPFPSKSVRSAGWDSGALIVTSLFNYTGTDKEGNWTSCKAEITREEYSEGREKPLVKKENKTYERTITYYTAADLKAAESASAGSYDSGGIFAGKSFKDIMWEILVALLFLSAIGHMIFINFIRRARYKIVFTPEHFEEQRRLNNLPLASTAEEDEQAWNLLNDAFYKWKVVRTTPEGEEYRKPKRMRHISASAEKIDQAIALAPTNPEVIERINELTDVVNSNEERYFTGSKLLIGVAAGVGCLLAYTGGGMSSIITFALAIALYILASRTPVFLIEKRDKYGMGSVSGGIFAGVFAMIAGAQTIRTTTKWDDGSKTVEDDHSQHWIAWILGLAVIFMLGVMIAFWSMINYVRNYILYI